jgi:NAD(P)-dependent dehydrogenase (short-subunit alcohol dehydrogenase family)
MRYFQFDRITTVNTRGPLLCLRGWARVRRAEQGTGSLVAVSSISARLVDRAMGVYCASKAALSMLVSVAAAEWGPGGLRVNAVAPVVTRTPMIGRGRPTSDTAILPRRLGIPQKPRGSSGSGAMSAKEQP